MKRYTNTMVCCVFFFLGLLLRAPFVGAFFVEENIVWGVNESPIQVEEDIIITESGSLTIEPGVHVIFDTDVGIEVLGRLDILGTEENPIVLISDDGYWNGISASGENAQVVIQNANIKNASTVLLLDHVSVTVRNSLFENNDLVVEGIESNLDFQGNIFVNNSILGYIDFNTDITAENNTISGGDTPALIVSVPDYDPFQKEIQGDIPFYFQESLIVPPDSRLDIMPGAQLYFDSSLGITVLGGFSVQGSESHSVIMASSARLFDHDLSDFSVWNTWQGITFLPTESQEYTMQYCNFSDIQSGIFIMGAQLHAQHCSMDRSVGFIADTSILHIDNFNSENSIYESIVGYNSSSITVSNTAINKLSFEDNRDAITILGNSSFVGDSLQISANSGSLVSVFDDSVINVRDSSFSGNDENYHDLVNIFNDSNAQFENIIVQNGKSNGMVLFNDSGMHIENSQIRNLDGIGIWIFDGENIPVSQVSIIDTEIQNNSVGISVIRSIVSIRNSLISGNAEFGAYIESGLGSIDARENDWGSSSGPFHETKNQQGSGDTISNHVKFVPWIGYDVLVHGLINDNWEDEIVEEVTEDMPEQEEEIIQEEIIPEEEMEEEIPEEIEEFEIPPAAQQSFWSPVTNFPGGVITLRKEPSLSGEAIKTFPNDWVVYVQAVQVQDTSVVADGYHWFFVRDATDDVTGWMPGKTPDGSVEFLPFIPGKQDDFEYIASHIFSTKADRAEKIIEIVDHYYNNMDTKKSLYSGKDVVNFSLFNQANVPKELIYAIAAQESGGNRYLFNNEHVSPDYGHGIMQITFHGRWKEPDKWLENNWDNRGAYSKYFNLLCKNVNLSLSKNQKRGLNDYYDCYHNAGKNVTTEKPYKNYKEDSHNPIYKQYANTEQSMYANIKDALGVLQVDKYRKKCPKADTSFGGLIFSCNDIEKIIMVWGYNGLTEDPSRHYLREVAHQLANLGANFSGVSYLNQDKFIEKMRIANDNRKSIKVFSPVEFFVKDALSNITGSKNGIEFEDIPNSSYSNIDESIVVFFSENDLMYELVGTDTGVYGIIIESVQDGEQMIFQGIDIPVAVGERHQYEIDWDVVARGGNGVKVLIDKNADGEFEEILYVSDFVEGDFPRDENKIQNIEKKQSSSSGVIKLFQTENEPDEILETYEKPIVQNQQTILFDQDILQPLKKIIESVVVVVDSVWVDDDIDEPKIQPEINTKILQARADNVPTQKKTVLIIGGLIFLLLTFIGIRKKMYL
ncbi:MAG: right-handed parallel beta-helix repeat-containing protein [Candidatus Pacebacteria bacterium]|nr:right-handed parallel beta-helix repeat-containing protein [Candidatus Paceibacterota bacterium]